RLPPVIQWTRRPDRVDPQGLAILVERRRTSMPAARRLKLRDRLADERDPRNERGQPSQDFVVPAHDRDDVASVGWSIAGRLGNLTREASGGCKSTAGMLSPQDPPQGRIDGEAHAVGTYDLGGTENVPEGGDPPRVPVYSFAPVDDLGKRAVVVTPA